LESKDGGRRQKQRFRTYPVRGARRKDEWLDLILRDHDKDVSFT